MGGGSPYDEHHFNDYAPTPNQFEGIPPNQDHNYPNHPSSYDQQRNFNEYNPGQKPQMQRHPPQQYEDDRPIKGSGHYNIDQTQENQVDSNPFATQHNNPMNQQFQSQNNQYPSSEELRYNDRGGPEGFSGPPRNHNGSQSMRVPGQSKWEYQNQQIGMGGRIQEESNEDEDYQQSPDQQQQYGRSKPQLQNQDQEIDRELERRDSFFDKGLSEIVRDVQGIISGGKPSFRDPSLQGGPSFRKKPLDPETGSQTTLVLSARQDLKQDDDRQHRLDKIRQNHLKRLKTIEEQHRAESPFLSQHTTAQDMILNNNNQLPSAHPHQDYRQPLQNPIDEQYPLRQQQHSQRYPQQQEKPMIGNESLRESNPFQKNLYQQEGTGSNREQKNKRQEYIEEKVEKQNQKRHSQDNPFDDNLAGSGGSQGGRSLSEQFRQGSGQGAQRQPRQSKRPSNLPPRDIKSLKSLPPLPPPPKPQPILLPPEIANDSDLKMQLADLADKQMKMIVDYRQDIERLAQEKAQLETQLNNDRDQQAYGQNTKSNRSISQPQKGHESPMLENAAATFGAPQLKTKLQDPKKSSGLVQESKVGGSRPWASSKTASSQENQQYNNQQEAPKTRRDGVQQKRHPLRYASEKVMPENLPQEDDDFVQHAQTVGQSSKNQKNSKATNQEKKSQNIHPNRQQSQPQHQEDERPINPMHHIEQKQKKGADAAIQRLRPQEAVPLSNFIGGRNFTSLLTKNADHLFIIEKQPILEKPVVNEREKQLADDDMKGLDQLDEVMRENVFYEAQIRQNLIWKNFDVQSDAQKIDHLYALINQYFQKILASDYHKITVPVFALGEVTRKLRSLAIQIFTTQAYIRMVNCMSLEGLFDRIEEGMEEIGLFNMHSFIQNSLASQMNLQRNNNNGQQIINGQLVLSTGVVPKSLEPIITEIKDKRALDYHNEQLNEDRMDVMFEHRPRPGGIPIYYAPESEKKQEISHTRSQLFEQESQAPSDDNVYRISSPLRHVVKNQEKLVTPLANDGHLQYPPEEDLLKTYAYNHTYNPSALAQRLAQGQQKEQEQVQPSAFALRLSQEALNDQAASYQQYYQQQYPLQSHINNNEQPSHGGGNSLLYQLRNNHQDDVAGSGLFQGSSINKLSNHLSGSIVEPSDNDQIQFQVSNMLGKIRKSLVDSNFFRNSPQRETSSQGSPLRDIMASLSQTNVVQPSSAMPNNDHQLQIANIYGKIRKSLIESKNSSQSSPIRDIMNSLSQTNDQQPSSLPDNQQQLQIQNIYGKIRKSLIENRSSLQSSPLGNIMSSLSHANEQQQQPSANSPNEQLQLQNIYGKIRKSLIENNLFKNSPKVIQEQLINENTNRQVEQINPFEQNHSNNQQTFRDIQRIQTSLPQIQRMRFQESGLTNTQSSDNQQIIEEILPQRINQQPSMQTYYKQRFQNEQVTLPIFNLPHIKLEYKSAKPLMTRGDKKLNYAVEKHLEAINKEQKLKTPYEDFITNWFNSIKDQTQDRYFKSNEEIYKRYDFNGNQQDVELKFKLKEEALLREGILNKKPDAQKLYDKIKELKNPLITQLFLDKNLTESEQQSARYKGDDEINAEIAQYQQEFEQLRLELIELAMRQQLEAEAAAKKAAAPVLPQIVQRSNSVVAENKEIESVQKAPEARNSTIKRLSVMLAPISTDKPPVLTKAQSFKNSENVTSNPQVNASQQENTATQKDASDASTSRLIWSPNESSNKYTSISPQQPYAFLPTPQSRNSITQAPIELAQLKKIPSNQSLGAQKLITTVRSNFTLGGGETDQQI